MMNRKKIIALFVSAALICSEIPCPVSAASADSGTLPLLERVDIAGDSGYLSSKLVNKNGEEVSITSRNSRSTSRKRAASLPDSYDSRDYGYITPIRDQGVSGGCWAFAAMKSLEADSVIQQLSALSDTDLSESHLIWYTYNKLTDTSDPLYGDYLSTRLSSQSDYYTAGGNAYIAMFILANYWGAVRESSAPFSADSTLELQQMVSSMASQPSSLRTQSDVHLKEAVMYDEDDTDAIKEAIMAHGSVDVSLYYDISNMYHSDTVSSAYESSHTADDANHSVSIVGWDDSFNTFSNAAPGSGAWLIANSYGSNYSYNNDGYYWVSYYDTSLTEFCSFEAESADTYDTSFQYDGFGWGNLYYDTEDLAFGNIFTNTEDTPQQLGAAGFYTISENQPYKIEVYRHVWGNKPTSGTLISQCTTSGTIEHAGYHTVSLNQPVAVGTGEIFSVVVTFYSENGSTVYVPMEGASDPFSTQRYSSESGQSYLYTNDSWTDTTAYRTGRHSTTNLNNVCLKALASSISEDAYEAQESGATLPPVETPDASATVSPGVSGSAAPSGSLSPLSSVSPSATDSSGFIPGTTASDTPHQTTPVPSLQAPISSSAASALPTQSAAPSNTPRPTGSVGTLSSAAPKNTATANTSSVTVTVKKTKITLGKGEKVRIPFSVSPASVKNKLTWKSKNKKIATVSKTGKVKGKKPGKTRVILSSASGLRISIRIVVKKKPASIFFSAKTRSLKKGQTCKPKLLLSRKSASYHRTFRSSRPGIASVSSHGKIHAKKAGTARITVTTYNRKKAILILRVRS